MYAFIDESGIQFQSGHSVFAVVFVEAEQLDGLNNSINTIERNLRLEAMHWSKMGRSVKAKLIPALSELTFSYQVIAVPNPIASTEDALGAGLTHALQTEQLKGLIIDGDWSRAQIGRIKKQLRIRGISVANLRGGNDKAFPGLRLADVIAGLQRQVLDGPTVENLAYEAQLISHHIKNATLSDGQRTG